MCHDAAELFLKDCAHLAEYRSLLDQGYAAPLTIGGRSLLEVLSLCQLEPGNYCLNIEIYPRSCIADYFTDDIQNIVSVLISVR